MDNLKTFRKQKGYTQEDFSKRCGIPLRTYQRIESGSIPSKENMEKIINALDLDLEDAEILKGCYGYFQDNHIVSEFEKVMTSLSKTVSTSDIIKSFERLNFNGKIEAIHLLELLEKIPEYSKSDSD